MNCSRVILHIAVCVTSSSHHPTRSILQYTVKEFYKDERNGVAELSIRFFR